ncbi:MAG: hypothetical protein JSV04_12670 [Candidatus Heimdallarchaeota archaeon]|nr:MAG: hypothetical protein JSV04_12670 [Candidatus Heimdallarchaeota archaeon]
MSYNIESEDETHDVKINDVKPLEKRINVVFQVTNVGDAREINKRSGETHRVCDFTVADDTASITLTLWNEDIDALEVGKVYKLSNGFANVFQNSLRLSKGRFGTLTDDSTVFDEINEDTNKSSEHIEDPRRRSRRGGYNRGYGGGRSSGYGDRSSRGYDSDRRSRF